mmetsp:Transcript_15382/g.41782  ORF Transcript_15382/g.41782 Transcript_15382/m.41782 type:complete len:283 (+) Transcript_15382:61-909(+)
MTFDSAVKKKLATRSKRTFIIFIFISGIFVGSVFTLLAISLIPEPGERELHHITPQALAPLRGKSSQRKDFWIETISDLPGPRIYILHNVVTLEEAAHLKSLGIIKGMEKALIIPYGGKELVASTTRTNTGAWLDFQQDEVVRKVERLLADVTATEPEHGENLQILHYEVSQQFKEHHDYFDPALDPPENFEPGGNRMATAVIYLQNADVGGETDFMKIGIKIKPDVGDAVLFYDLQPDGQIDNRTIHAGTPPVGGEKWVATKWIHQRRYQGVERKERPVKV